MFSTPKEAHIAIELELQQVNTNRKQALQSEQLDYVINNSILDTINSKIDAKYNAKRDGFEDTQRNLDELRELKKKVVYDLYVDTTDRSYTILPSDYYRLTSGATRITNHYNKRLLTTVESNVTIYKATKNFADARFTTFTNYTGITFTINGNAFTYNKSLIRINSKFEIINAVLSYFKQFSSTFNIYWERYDNTFVKDSFIVISNSTVTFTIACTGYVDQAVAITTSVVQKRTSTGNKVTSPIDLIPSDQIADVLNNNKMINNRHKKPICEISNDRFYCYYNSEFRPLSIELAYLIKPTLINYYTNTMPEITITPEIISRAVDKLKVAIKDEQAYNMFLNQVNKVQ